MSITVTEDLIMQAANVATALGLNDDDIAKIKESLQNVDVEALAAQMAAKLAE